MKKRVLPSLIVLCLTFAGIAGCSSETDGNQKVVLNEVAHSIFYAPMYVAIEEGYFADEGIDLELVTGFGDLVLVQFNNEVTHPRPYNRGCLLYFF